MATLIPANTEQPVYEVQPQNGHDFKLTELHELLHCDMIEMIQTLDGRIMIWDEESKLQETPIKNTRASEFVVFPSAAQLRARIAALKEQAIEVIFAGELPDDPDAPSDFIAGDVLICSNDEVK